MRSKSTCKIDGQSLHGKAAIDSEGRGGKRCCLQQAIAVGTTQQPVQVHCLAFCDDAGSLGHLGGLRLGWRQQPTGKPTAGS